MKKYLVFTIREFLGLSNDYEDIMSSQAEILNKLKDIDQVSLQNQEMILESKETSYYDYITLKNILLVVLVVGLIGGGFAAINSLGGNTDNINSAVSELNQNIKGLAGVVKDAQGVSFTNLGPLFEKLNTNLADLSTKQLIQLNEILNHARVIRSVVKPNPCGKLNPLEGVKFEDLKFADD